MGETAERFVSSRIPESLYQALEREIERTAKETGVELSVSGMVRAILKKHLHRKEGQ